MNLYAVYDECDYAEESTSCLVWSNSKAEARTLYLRKYDDPRAVYDGSVKIIVQQQDPGVVKPVKPEPHVEGRRDIERAFGFQYEGDSCCDSCGLYECDGTCPVCTECDQCAECGHLDDCSHYRRSPSLIGGAE